MNEEKRRARRFEMALPVTVMSVGQKQGSLAAQSRDISSSGIFIECDREIHPGTTMELVVNLPEEITQAAPVRLRCLGRVVRVDRGPRERMGMAVAIERYEFMRLQDEPSRLNRIQ